jgi:hypothetical protein
VNLRKALLATMACVAGAGAVAQPACQTGETEVQNTNALLSDAYLCAVRGTDSWQEFHQAGGKLFDWKRGPGHPVDPTKEVGSWGTAQGTVTHTYGSTSYVWRVCRVGPQAGATYTLRSQTAGVISGATVVSGSVNQTTKPCP